MWSFAIRMILRPPVVKTRRRKWDEAALRQHVRDYPKARLIGRPRHRYTRSTSAKTLARCSISH